LALYGIQAAVTDRLVPALTGGTVYTDDLAPVEWLTDLSILRYAAGCVRCVSPPRPCDVVAKN
jgi:hypothetical protein